MHMPYNHYQHSSQYRIEDIKKNHIAWESYNTEFSLHVVLLYWHIMSLFKVM